MPADVTVLYFGAARERAGCAREVVSLEDPGPWSAERLLSLLESRHPALAGLRRHLRVAVNQEFVELSQAVPPGAEVALIPPVAGGAGCFRVVETSLVLDEVVRAVADERRGGLVTFSGQVRAQSHGKRVLRLSYEAYVPMAERTLASIGQAARERWPGVEVAVVHRVGTLLPGELAVVIAAAAPHRKEAFAACEFTLEQLKAQAPIWKKEHFEDGDVWVGLGP